MKRVQRHLGSDHHATTGTPLSNAATGAAISPETDRLGCTGHALRNLLEWTAEHEFWITCLIVPLLLFPNPWTWVGVAVLPLLWFMRWLHIRKVTRSTPLDLPILLLLLMIPVSLYASVDLELSLTSLLQILAGVSLFYAALNSLSSSNGLTRLVHSLILMGMTLAVIAPLGTQWVTDRVFSLPRIYEQLPRSLPETVHPNVLAGTIVLIVPLALGLLLCPALGTGRAKVPIKGLLLLSLVTMLITVVLTQSRGAYTALVAGLLVVATARFRWLGFLIPIAALGVFIVARSLGSAVIADALLRTGALGGWEGRQEVWARALYMMQDFPYTGIGLGTFSRVGPVMYPYFILSPATEVPHAHNLFLQVGVDLGLPGLIAFLAILTSSLFMAGRAYFVSCRVGAMRLASISLGLLGSLVVLVIHGVSDAVTWGSKPSVLPWLLFACTVTAYRLAMGKRGQETATDLSCAA